MKLWLTAYSYLSPRCPKVYSSDTENLELLGVYQSCDFAEAVHLVPWSIKLWNHWANWHPKSGSRFLGPTDTTGCASGGALLYPRTAFVVRCAFTGAGKGNKNTHSGVSKHCLWILGMSMTQILLILIHFSRLRRAELQTGDETIRIALANSQQGSEMSWV